MNIQQIQTYRLPAGLIQIIDGYEEEVYGGKLKPMLPLIAEMLPNTEDVAILHVDAGNRDNTVSIVFRTAEGDDKRSLPITGGLGKRLFLHAMATSTVYAALSGEYDFQTIYAFGSMLSDGVTPGDMSTYPLFAIQLLPSDIAPMLSDESISFDVYSVARLGQNRTEHASETRRAILRSVVLMYGAEASENIDEVFPMLRVGRVVTFNAYVPFPARILRPHPDTNTAKYVSKHGLLASDSITYIDHKPVYVSPQRSIISDNELDAVNRQMGLLG